MHFSPNGSILRRDQGLFDSPELTNPCHSLTLHFSLKGTHFQVHRYLKGRRSLVSSRMNLLLCRFSLALADFPVNVSGYLPLIIYLGEKALLNWRRYHILSRITEILSGYTYSEPRPQLFKYTPQFTATADMAD